VCQLYEIGESGNELFIAMELLDGEPLSSRIARGPVPTPESVEIASAILSALEAIHARALVHRDLKPSNVFLSRTGVKLLDFGLARAIQGDADVTSAVTQPGLVMGTPHYMSPEQLLGEAIDARSDLFAAGSILFELLVGRAAFEGKTTAQVFHAVMYEKVPSIGGSPALTALDRVIHRAMARKPADRYSTATDMAQDVRAAMRLGDSGAAPVARCVTRLIVLPLRLLRPDPDTDFLAFSLPDAITSSLAAFDALVVRSPVAAARYKGETPDLATLAADLDVDAAVTGSLLRAGNQLRVSMQLVEAPSGRVIWSQTAQALVDDVFRLQDDLTTRIVESLALPLTAGDQRSPERHAPSSPRAYEFFLRANELGDHAANWPVARDLYRQALEEDPTYAPAWARLGRIYRLLGKMGTGVTEDTARAEDAIRRALELNPDLALAHNIYAQLDIDRGRARDAMVRLLEQARRRSNDPELFAGLVYACRFCGLLQASVSAHQVGRRLDPHLKTSVVHTFWMQRDYDAVVETGQEAPLVRAFALVALNRRSEALAFLTEKARGAPARMGQIVAGLRLVLEDRPAEAIQSILRLTDSGFQDSEAMYYFARELAQAGEPDGAMRLLAKSAAGGFTNPSVFRADDWLEPLRARPDFADLLERVEMEHARSVEAFDAAQGPAILGSSV
jgi:TolB-like protein/tetratricopeptide (TPR) repeat protein